ncbi:MAG TPA: tetratricopeptide repeat protein [Chthoniobacterales bacterium]|nr:tetratricopeptide repeat protein [Chthoniobacterales bacterium]
MSSELKPHLHLEVGHILFLDIVGYSKLLADEQKELILELNHVVRETKQFQTAEAEGKLTRLPTGDGIVLVFMNNPEAPLECALEINRKLQSRPQLKLRMGIHSGPVNPVADVNDQANLAGAGINIAQRVMSCGDAGHILLSKHFAEDLEHYAHWRSHLHDVGRVEVKHGARIPIVNLYTDQLGNAALPAKLRRARTAFRLKSAVVVVLLLIAVLGVGFWMLRRSQGKFESQAALIPSKSLAVLPFENLSRDPDNAYFADGIQDEILTRLSKIADLKVISHTSTQHYKSAPVNLPEIAKQLGVAHILEGSVQKSGDSVRVNVQLIKAANDSHLWADTYDRRLTDIFSVESEVAKAIADTLKAKLTGAEEQLIAARPTSNLTAYELYLKGRVLWGKRGGDNIRQAIGFYEQAIVRDPNYAPACAGLAEAYVILPIYTDASAREAYAKAKAAALKALQLDDKLAEAHNALAMVLFLYLDIAGSIPEFQRAIALNPNYATAHHWYGFNPLSTLGRFDEAIAESKRAVELDPLSPVINSDLGSNLMVARRYDEAIAQLRKTLEIDPTFSLAHGALGEALQFKGDLPGAIAEYTKAQELAADPRIRVLMAAAKAQSGDKDAAVRMLAELEEASRNREIPGAQRAVLYTSLGNRTEAIRCLEQSVADHDSQDVAWIKVYPKWDPLRGDPRFEALVQKVVGPGNK